MADAFKDAKRGSRAAVPRRGVVGVARGFDHRREHLRRDHDVPHARHAGRGRRQRRPRPRGRLSGDVRRHLRHIFHVLHRSYRDHPAVLLRGHGAQRRHTPAAVLHAGEFEEADLRGGQRAGHAERDGRGRQVRGRDEGVAKATKGTKAGA